jgi:hypothetical protein
MTQLQSDPSNQPASPTEDQLKEQIRQKLEEPQPPGASSASVSAKAAAVARKTLQQRRATGQRRKVKPQPKRELPEEPPQEAPPAVQFVLAGFGQIYAASVEYLATMYLEKKPFESARKRELIDVADKYANVRMAQIAWLAEFMPELALVGATVDIILETPHAGTHHVDPGNDGKRKDGEGEGTDGSGDKADSLRSSESRVPAGADL